MDIKCIYHHLSRFRSMDNSTSLEQWLQTVGELFFGSYSTFLYVGDCPVINSRIPV